MSFFAKQRILFYKRFKLDIWGIFKNTLQWKIDRSNYYSNFLRIKLINTFKSITYNKKELQNTKKHLNFIIGYKHLKNLKLKLLIDRTYNIRILSMIEKTLKKEAKKGKKVWYIKKNSFFKTRKQVYKFRINIYKFLIRLIFIKYLMFKFFKTTITQKMEKTFSYFFTKKPRRDKVYFRTPFIYEMRFYPLKFKKYKTKADFLTLRVTKLFYIIYNYRQLKNLCKKAKKQIGLFEQNYLLLMECKLPSFIYRTSFIPNMFESIDFIKASNVWINKFFISYIYYVVKPKDMIGFRVLIKGWIFWQFFKRLRRRAFIFLFPKYIYISIIFFLIILLRAPLKKEIINPISIDMYRLYNYAI